MEVSRCLFIESVVEKRVIEIVGEGNSTQEPHKLLNSNSFKWNVSPIDEEENNQIVSLNNYL